ncbi:protein no-on-transient A-like [Sinocyclocheilus grahami]|uniref:protein no-on-transient A-like n=1 Tax=Sinocyclocheilus grahami TaxID=75366 RepID=UPI0007AC7989|nr:PREDICTED: protein no-on-transient A-like [Sinocyclocheilus grahami]
MGGGLGDGGGPSHSDSVRSMMTGGIKAGRWQTVQSRLHSGDFKNGNLSDHALSSDETLDNIPSTGATPRPRTLLRQQSLQQPLIQAPAPCLASRPPISQSLGQLHTQPGSGGGGGAGPGRGGGASSRNSRGGPAGGGASRCKSGGAGGRASHGNPGSVDHMMGQIKRRGLDVKSFLPCQTVVHSVTLYFSPAAEYLPLPSALCTDLLFRDVLFYMTEYCLVCSLPKLV